MARGESTNYIDFSGGVNSNAGQYLLAENQAKDSRNFHTTPIGSLKKRTGFTTANDSTLNSVADLDTTHSLFPCNTATKSLIVVGTDNDASSDTIAKMTTAGVCSVLETGKTAGKRWEWVQAPTGSGSHGPIYGVNGTDTPQTWDGSASSMTDWTATTGTVPSAAKYLLYHADRIWAAGLGNGRVRYTGLTSDAVPAPDPRNWDTDGYVDIEPQDGEDFTGIQDVGPYILFTKPRKSYVITDPVTGAWRQISNTIGCIAHRSMVATPKGTIFLSEDSGVCITDGSDIKRIGDEIDPFIRQAATDNPTTLPFAAGFLWENSYYLSIPYGAATNDLLLEYDLDTESWWPHSINSNQFALLDPAGTPRLYSAYATSGRVHRAFTPATFTDSGSAYSGGTYYTGPYYPWGEPHLNKRVTQFRVDGSGTWSLAAAKSFSDDYENLDGVALETIAETETFGGNGTYGGTGTFAPAAEVSQWAYYTPGFGRAWSLKITNTDERDLEIFSLAAFLRSRTD